MSNLLPDDILVIILHKLPVKSLIKFTSVSKSWNSLITSPSFIATHNKSPANSHLHLLVKCYSRIHNQGWWYSLFQPHSTSQTLNFPLSSRSSNVPFEIAGSVNGVLCLIDAVDSNLIVLWNPIIHKHVKLPKPSIISPVSFACLGFDYGVNDFKVVRIAYTVDGARIEIWSLKDPVWRLLDSTECCCDMPKAPSQAFFMAGSVHWLAIKGSRVVVFDVEKERFGTIGLPNELRQADNGSIWLSRFGASLGLMFLDNRLHPCRCEIWVMTEYGVEESWVKMIGTELQLGVENKSWVREHWTNMILAAAETELRKSFSEVEDEIQYSEIFGLCYEQGDCVACVDMFTESLALLDVDIQDSSSDDCNIMY